MPNLGIDIEKTNKFVQKHRFMTFFYNPLKTFSTAIIYFGLKFRK